MNDTLHRALTNADLREDDIAAQLDVDPKTVRRWLSGRTPYPRYRTALAGLLGVDEHKLWPETRPRRPHAQLPGTGIIGTYPHRWAVPRETWQHLFESAQQEIGVLVYAGLFLAEDLGLLRTLTDRATQGVTIRILLGDPDSPKIAERGEEEGVGEAMAAKIRNALVFYHPLTDVHGIQIKTHDTALYTSIYRADDQLMINPHIYGVPAAQAPVIHLRQTHDNDMASTYRDSFERIWTHAQPLK